MSLHFQHSQTLNVYVSMFWIKLDFVIFIISDFKRRWYHEYNIIWYNFLLFILNLYITMIISARIVKIAKRFVWKIWNLDEKLKNREKINHCTIRLLRNIFVFKFFHSSKQFTCIICMCIYKYWLINLSVYEI